MFKPRVQSALCSAGDMYKLAGANYLPGYWQGVLSALRGARGCSEGPIPAPLTLTLTLAPRVWKLPLKLLLLVMCLQGRLLLPVLLHPRGLLQQGCIARLHLGILCVQNRLASACIILQYMGATPSRPPALPHRHHGL